MKKTTIPNQTNHYELCIQHYGLNFQVLIMHYELSILN